MLARFLAGAQGLSILTDIEQRLRAGPYRVVRDVALPGGMRAAVAASRTYFSWKGLVILSQHILVAQIDNADSKSVEALFGAGFAYAKSVNRIPLPRGFQFGYIVLPVIITKTPNPELIRYVAKSPRKHWSLFELPIVVDADSGTASYFHGKALWGYAYFSDMLSVARKYIDRPAA
jgi:hypothetical protein